MFPAVSVCQWQWKRLVIFVWCFCYDSNMQICIYCTCSPCLFFYLRFRLSDNGILRIDSVLCVARTGTFGGSCTFTLLQTNFSPARQLWCSVINTTMGQVWFHWTTYRRLPCRMCVGVWSNYVQTCTQCRVSKVMSSLGAWRSWWSVYTVQV